MPYKVRATTQEILDFIHLKEMIEPWQLRDKFGYSDHVVRTKLSRLKKRGLMLKIAEGRWILTVAGEARLKYYAKRDKRT